MTWAKAEAIRPVVTKGRKSYPGSRRMNESFYLFIFYLKILFFPLFLRLYILLISYHFLMVTKIIGKK